LAINFNGESVVAFLLRSIKSHNIALVFVFFASMSVYGQSTDTNSVPTAEQTPATTTTNTSTTTTPELTLQQRVMRARAVAAAGNLSVARSELEAVRKESTDTVLRHVIDVLLAGISMELSDYGRTQALLDEAFNTRNNQTGASMGTYFALAGRTLNCARARLDRYRTFGFNVSDTDLQPEAINDLNRLRQLLERIVEQSKTVMEGDKPRGADAASLIEEAASLRFLLARDSEEKTLWQREVADTRQHFVISDPRLPNSQISKSTYTMTEPVRNAVLTNNEKETVPPISAQIASTQAMPPLPPSPTIKEQPKEMAEPILNKQVEDKSKVSTEQAAEAPKTQAIDPPALPSKPVRSLKASTQLGAKLVNVGVLNDKAAYRVLPSYPQTALNARITGIVMIHLTMDEKGYVVSIDKTDGPELLKLECIEAVKQWKFKPTIINGKPVRATGYVSFNFKL
jgi:TonB family protein